MNQRPNLWGHSLTGLFIIALMVLLTSCASEDENHNKIQEAAIKIAEETSIDPMYQVNFNDSFLNNLPTPFEISKDLKDAGVQFQGKITNSSENDIKYISSYKKALNLGVYSSDLTYSLYNEQFQQTISYYRVIERMSRKLGLLEVIEGGKVGDRFESNIGTRDSLEKIVHDLQNNAKKHFQGNEMQDIHLLYFTGAWVEALYLGTSYITAENEGAVVDMVIEQLRYLPSIREEISKIDTDDETIMVLLAQLNALDSLRHHELKKLKEGKSMNFGLIRGNISLIRNSLI